MADRSPISTELGPASPAVPSQPTLTRRGLLGGAGMAAGATLAPLPGMSTINPAAAQTASAEARPLDAAFPLSRRSGINRPVRSLAKMD